MMIYLLNKIGVSLEFPFIHLVCTSVIINWWLVIRSNLLVLVASE